MYRLATEVSQPFTFVLVSTAFALGILWLRGRLPARSAVLLGIGVIGLWAVSTPALAGYAVGSLERPYPPVAPETFHHLGTDSIVVLASGVRDRNSLRPVPELAEGTVVRTLHGARLYLARPVPVIVSGGTASGQTRIAPMMAELLVTLGVPTEDIIVEDRSSDTFENARESARLLRERGLSRPALVTEATHLRRSVLCFRGQGVEVVPVGVNYRTSDLRADWFSFLPHAGAASTVRVAAHEWIGMVWYWLNGRFDDDRAGLVPDRSVS